MRADCDGRGRRHAGSARAAGAVSAASLLADRVPLVPLEVEVGRASSAVSGVPAVSCDCSSARDEPGQNRGVADEKGLFIESLAAHPCGDLGVALAGVTAAAGGHDVVERVAAAA